LEYVRTPHGKRSALEIFMDIIYLVYLDKSIVVYVDDMFMQHVFKRSVNNI